MNKVSIVERKGVMRNGKFIIPCAEFVDIEQAIVDGEKSNNIFIGTYPSGEKTYQKIDDEGKYMYMTDSFSVYTVFKNGVSVVGMYDERFGYKYGLVDDGLNLKLSMRFDSIVSLSDRFYKIERKGLYGVYDILRDKIIIETEFVDIKYDEEQNSFSLVY